MYSDISNNLLLMFFLCSSLYKYQYHVFMSLFDKFLNAVDITTLKITTKECAMLAGIYNENRLAWLLDQNNNKQVPTNTDLEFQQWTSQFRQESARANVDYDLPRKYGIFTTTNNTITDGFKKPIEQGYLPLQTIRSHCSNDTFMFDIKSNLTDISLLNIDIDLRCSELSSLVLMLYVEKT